MRENIYFYIANINIKRKILLKLKYSWNIQHYSSGFSNLIS